MDNNPAIPSPANVPFCVGYGDNKHTSFPWPDEKTRRRIKRKIAAEELRRLDESIKASEAAFRKSLEENAKLRAAQVEKATTRKKVVVAPVDPKLFRKVVAELKRVTDFLNGICIISGSQATAFTQQQNERVDRARKVLSLVKKGIK